MKRALLALGATVYTANGDGAQPVDPASIQSEPVEVHSVIVDTPRVVSLSHTLPPRPGALYRRPVQRMRNLPAATKVVRFVHKQTSYEDGLAGNPFFYLGRVIGTVGAGPKSSRSMTTIRLATGDDSLSLKECKATVTPATANAKHQRKELVGQRYLVANPSGHGPMRSQRAKRSSMVAVPLRKPCLKSGS